MNNLIITIQHKEKVIEPAIKEDVTLIRSFEGKPSKLEFSAYNDADLVVFEGDRVKAYVDDEMIFHGFIFEKNNDKDDFISILCYDQMRYLKNKDTYVIKDKKASDVVKMLCDDFLLKYGDLSDTEYIIPMYVADNKTLIDIIYWYLYNTYTYTKKLYEIYDDNGLIQLKTLEDMKLDYLLDGDVLENINYKSSIDEDTYNVIKLVENKKQEGEGRKIFLEKNNESIAEWGVLQYFETISEKVDGAKKAKDLLLLKNRKTRSLSVKNALGDIRVRGGSSLFCMLDLGDVKLNNFMLVEKVTHRFKDKEHFMDLSLKGSDIDV